MPNTVGQMTKSELKQLIAGLIEEKLLELIGDPDEGLPLRRSLRDRLLKQKRAVQRGDYGRPFDDVVKDLDLA